MLLRSLGRLPHIRALTAPAPAPAAAAVLDVALLASTQLLPRAGSIDIPYRSLLPVTAVGCSWPLPGLAVKHLYLTSASTLCYQPAGNADRPPFARASPTIPLPVRSAVCSAPVATAVPAGHSLGRTSATPAQRSVREVVALTHPQRSMATSAVMGPSAEARYLP